MDGILVGTDDDILDGSLDGYLDGFIELVAPIDSVLGGLVVGFDDNISIGPTDGVLEGLVVGVDDNI